MMNDNYLEHLFGIKDHKYIARVKNPSSKGYKYIYFYNEAAYNRWRRGENGDNPKNQGVAALFQPDEGENYVSPYKYSNDVNFGGKIANKEFSTKKINSLIKKIAGTSVKDLKRHANQYRKTKYLAKVKLSNGRFRYFYSRDEYVAYLRRQVYQKNEPNFMKNISEIEGPSDIYNDMMAVNPNYNNTLFMGKTDGSYNYNCLLCTMTYELRRRGYDVEAGPYTSTLADKIGNSETSQKNGVYWYNTLFKNTKSVTLKSDKNIEEELSKMPNTRGDLSVQWKNSNSGHSMAYEVDLSGKVTIVDAQTGEMFSNSEDIQRLMSKTSGARYTRLDNAEFNEVIMDGVFIDKKKNK